MADTQVSGLSAMTPRDPALIADLDYLRLLARTFAGEERNRLDEIVERFADALALPRAARPLPTGLSLSPARREELERLTLPPHAALLLAELLQELDAISAALSQRTTELADSEARNELLMANVERERKEYDAMKAKRDEAVANLAAENRIHLQVALDGLPR